MTLAWHGDPALKAEVVARLRAHREQDAFIQGRFQEFAPDLAVGYRGCAIGCTLPLQPASSGCDCKHCREPRGPDGGWHEEVHRLYGIPTPIAYRIDNLFESLPFVEAAAFAVDVIEAIPVGADLSAITSRVINDAYDEPLEGRYGEDTTDGPANLIADLKDAPVPAPVGDPR